MRRILFLTIAVAMIMATPAALAQSASATYTLGDGEADSDFTALPGSSNCPIPLTVTIPAGETIVGVDVTYQITAHNGAWTNEARSQLRCVSPGGLDEPQLYQQGGSTGGTETYSRTGLNIANGVTGGGDIDFELHVGRTWGGSGCDTMYQYVPNGTFTVTVHYGAGPPPGDCTIQIDVWTVGWCDAVTWSLTNGLGTVVLSGGPYGSNCDITETHEAVNEPYTFFIESTLGDNLPFYEVSVDGTVVVSGQLSGNDSYTSPPIECFDDVVELTMLDPVGTGSVSPAPGVHTYPENSNANLVATPLFGASFDYWEVDGVFYSANPTETLLMDDDYTVQAFFVAAGAEPLPFYEDFTGVPVDEIPGGWGKDPDTTNWGVVNSNLAGGDPPEMRFNWTPSGVDTYRLVTPLLDGTGMPEISLWFNHYLSHWGGPYTLSVETSLDGVSWTERWSIVDPPGNIDAEQVFVNLDALIGEEFHIAFVFDGDTFNTNNWNIDNIGVGIPPEMSDLTMLAPDGQGAVIPPVGVHTFLDFEEPTLAALPSSTWYALDATGAGVGDYITFDPANVSVVNVLGPMVDTGFHGGGTWADGQWWVSSNTPALFTVDPVTGAETLIGTPGAELNGIAYDEVNGIMYGTSFDGIDSLLHTVDMTDASTTLIGTIQDGIVIDIAFGDGVLYGHSISYDTIMTIDTATATPTVLGPTGVNANFGQGMEYDKDNGRLFLAIFNQGTFAAELREVDTTTGATMFWGTFNANQVTALAIPYDIVHPWEFDRWEVDGALYSTDPVTTLLMSDDYEAQAFFTTALDTVELTMLPPVGDGSVSPPPGVHEYLLDSTAFLSATGDPGFMLDYWEVDGVWYSDSPSISILMDDDRTAQAFFDIDTTKGCDPDSIFSQPMVCEEVFTNSDLNAGYLSADDFMDLTDPITGLNWWGIELECCWFACAKSNLDFEITFYEPGASPGAVVHQEIVTATRVQTDEHPFDVAAYGFINKYTAYLAAPVSITEGWVSIAAVDSGECWFLWGDGGPSTTTSEYYQMDLDVGTWEPGGYGYDMAFCLLGGDVGVPAPTNCQAFPDVICAGDDVELTADSAFEIYWYDDECGGNLVGIGSPLIVNPMVDTTYYARAYDPVEDEWSDTCCDVTVIVDPAPSCLIGGPSWVDEGDVDVVYSVAEYPTAIYTWTVTNAVITDGDGTHEITIDVTGIEGDVIEIEVEIDLDGCICEGSRSISIGAPQIPATGPFGIGLLLLALGGLMKFAKRK